MLPASCRQLQAGSLRSPEGRMCGMSCGTTPENSLCSLVIPFYVLRSPHQGVMNFVTLLRRVFCRLYFDPMGGFYCNENAHY